MAEGSRAQLAVVQAGTPTPDARATTGLIWALGLGSFGLAWSKTTIGTYLPAVLGEFTSSASVVGVVLSAEGWFAISLPLLVGPLSDATRTPFGRRRPYMAFAVGPIALSLAMVAFMPNLVATAFVVFAFFFAYYIYEPPYRGLYPDLLPSEAFARSQGAQHVMRGIAVGIALISGGFLLHVWQPFPFVLAAAVSAIALSAVIALVHERAGGRRHYERFRSYLAAPWRIVKAERDVRYWMLVNTAWEATFAGMYTFVVLYITKGLNEPLYVSSTVLAVVAAGYVVAAMLAGRLGERFGIGRVSLVVSIVYGAGLTLCFVAREWHNYYYALIAPIAFAGGMTMTLAWGLLFKVMPAHDRGAVSGLGIMTKGIGLLAGPLGVGILIDIFKPVLDSTDGYAAMWPAVGLPVLLVTPFVAALARSEARRATDTGSPPAA
jgi:MFS family permease